MVVLNGHVKVDGPIKVKLAGLDRDVNLLINTGCRKSAVSPALVEQMGYRTEDGSYYYRSFNGTRIPSTKIAYIPFHDGVGFIEISAMVLELWQIDLVIGAEALCQLRTRIFIGCGLVVEMRPLDELSVTWTPPFVSLDGTRNTRLTVTDEISRYPSPDTMLSENREDEQRTPCPPAPPPSRASSQSRSPTPSRSASPLNTSQIPSRSSSPSDDSVHSDETVLYVPPSSRRRSNRRSRIPRHCPYC